MKFQKSACIEPMYGELPFLERFQAARADGFDYVEFWSRTILQQPDGLYRLGGGDGGDQLEPHEPLIPDLFQALEDPGIADLPGTGLVAAGRICHVDVAELVAVSADVVA